MGKQTYKKNFAATLKKLEDTYHADVDLVKNTLAEITDAELNNPDYVAMFGQKLKAERKSKNITLDQEANQLGINRTTILDMACLEDAPQTAQMVGNLGKISSIASRARTWSRSGRSYPPPRRTWASSRCALRGCFGWSTNWIRRSWN